MPDSSPLILAQKGNNDIATLYLSIAQTLTAHTPLWCEYVPHTMTTGPLIIFPKSWQYSI